MERKRMSDEQIQNLLDRLHDPHTTLQKQPEIPDKKALKSYKTLYTLLKQHRAVPLPPDFAEGVLRRLAREQRRENIVQMLHLSLSTLGLLTILSLSIIYTGTNRFASIFNGLFSSHVLLDLLAKTHGLLQEIPFDFGSLGIAAAVVLLLAILDHYLLRPGST